MDVESEKNGQTIDRERLDFIYRLKTSALLEASLMIGAVLAGADDIEVAQMEAAGTKLGLAFQIQDDILDIEGDAETFGKPIGSDEENGKSTYPSLLGLEKCHALVHELSQQAVDALASFADAGILPELAYSLADRNH